MEEYNQTCRAVGSKYILTSIDFSNWYIYHSLDDGRKKFIVGQC